MRVIVAHGSEAKVKERRKTLHAAGMTCDADDCVPWSDLPLRLGAKQADLVLLFVDEATESAANGAKGVVWDHIREGVELASCPVISVGDSDSGREMASAVGAARHIDPQTFAAEMDRLAEEGTTSTGRRELGKIISVISPLPGSGGATLACNLAGGLVTKSDRRVALIELTRRSGALATMLNVSPEYTIANVCERCDSLDAMRLRNSAVEHSSGLSVLVANPESVGNEHLSAQAIRRLVILSRVAFDYAVLTVDADWDECQHVAVSASDSTVVVIRPDVLSMRRAGMMLEWARDKGVSSRLKIVVNRWGQGGQLSKSQIESTLGVPVEAWIPEDAKRVNTALNQGLLLKELSSLATITRKVNSLATQLNGKA